MSETDKTILQLDQLPPNVAIGESDLFYAVINNTDYAVPFARIFSAIIDPDLQAIASIEDESGFLKKVSANTWALTSVKDEFSDWFELAGTAPNQYIRCKYPFGCDYEVQAYTGGSWLPPNIWAGIPIASASVLGAVKIGTGVAVAPDGTISVATGAGMVYPAAGIPVSTGTAWAASIANNSANWNTAYSWGNHAGLYAPISTVSSQWVTSGSNIYYNSGNVGIGVDTPTLGKLQVNGIIAAYGYASASNLPAITLDKVGNYSYGIGADGTNMRVRYGSIYGMGNPIWLDGGGIQHYFDGSLTTTGAAYINTALAIGHGNEIWTMPSTNANAELYINYRGYADGFTQFRDLYIANGKGTTIASFIGASGYFGIGKAPTAYRLEVAGDIYAEGWIRTTSQRGWYNETYGGGIYMTDSTYVRLYNGKSFYVPANIVATGEITAYAPSDIRLKRNVIPIYNATETIKRMNPVQFNWNGTAVGLNKEKDEQRLNYGLLAQELEQVLPDLIHTIHGSYKSIDYNGLFAIIIKGLQELNQKVEQWA